MINGNWHLTSGFVGNKRVIGIVADRKVNAWLTWEALQIMKGPLKDSDVGLIIPQVHRIEEINDSV